jgi:hypothetical protein
MTASARARSAALPAMDYQPLETVVSTRASYGKISQGGGTAQAVVHVNQLANRDFVAGQVLQQRQFNQQTSHVAMLNNAQGMFGK